MTMTLPRAQAIAVHQGAEWYGEERLRTTDKYGNRRTETFGYFFFGPDGEVGHWIKVHDVFVTHATPRQWHSSNIANLVNVRAINITTTLEGKEKS